MEWLSDFSKSFWWSVVLSRILSNWRENIQNYFRVNTLKFAFSRRIRVIIRPVTPWYHISIPCWAAIVLTATMNRKLKGSSERKTEFRQEWFKNLCNMEHKFKLHNQKRVTQSTFESSIRFRFLIRIWAECSYEFSNVWKNFQKATNNWGICEPSVWTMFQWKHISIGDSDKIRPSCRTIIEIAIGRFQYTEDFPIRRSMCHLISAMQNVQTTCTNI